MSRVQNVPLNDKRFFSFVPGLWEGKTPPFQTAAVLRGANFRGDGLLAYENVTIVKAEERQLAVRELRRGDTIVERAGGGPKQPVGRVAYFDPPDELRYATSNFTTALRIIDRDTFDAEYVFLFLLWRYLCGATESLQRATTGIRNLDWGAYQQFEVPQLTLEDQRAITLIIRAIRTIICTNEKQLQTLEDFKRVAMRALFSQGLHGKAQQETEIGLIPESWTARSLAEVCTLSTGSTPPTHKRYLYVGTTPFIKTAEIVNNRISSAASFVSKEAISECSLKIYPPGTLLMAMYGQGKTRGQVSLLEVPATTSQNAAAIEVGEAIRPDFLWHFLLSRYDHLRGIGSLGHLSHLNLGYLRELRVPVPATIAEQKEIAAILDAIDRKIDLHKRKRVVLDELFRSLLHKLMTGEIRVADLDLTALASSSAAETAA